MDNVTTLQGKIHHTIDEYLHGRADAEELDTAIRLAKLLRRKIDIERQMDSLQRGEHLARRAAVRVA